MHFSNPQTWGQGLPCLLFLNILSIITSRSRLLGPVLEHKTNVLEHKTGVLEHTCTQLIAPRQGSTHTVLEHTLHLWHATIGPIGCFLKKLNISELSDRSMWHATKPEPNTQHRTRVACHTQTLPRVRSARTAFFLCCFTNFVSWRSSLFYLLVGGL